MQNQSFNFTIPAHIIAALAPAVSVEDARPYLMGIHFEYRLAVATDGHILTVCEHEVELDAPLLLAFTKDFYAKAKAKKADTVEIANDFCRVLDKQGAVLCMVPTAPIDGTFPEWRRVVPNANALTAGTIYPSWARDMLRAVLETAKALDHAVVSFFGDDSLGGSPAVVRYGEKAAFSVIMPCREWFKPCEALAYPFAF